MNSETRAGFAIKAQRVMASLVMVITMAVSAIAAESSPSNLKRSMMNMMQQHPELMQEIMKNPHHLLAMTYRKSLFAFANILNKQAALGETVPPEFARTVVNEMNHNLDQLEKQQTQLLGTLSRDKQSLLGDVPKEMQQHLVDMKSRLDRLAVLAKQDTVNSKDVQKELEYILEYCQMGMGGMHGAERHFGDNSMLHHRQMGYMGDDETLDALVKQMHVASGDDKVELLEEIVTRLVQQLSENNYHGGQMLMPHENMNPHQMQDQDMDDDEDEME